ncbi:hypothetical protein D3C86_1672220 [compost metagenome]
MSIAFCFSQTREFVPSHQVIEVKHVPQAEHRDYVSYFLKATLFGSVTGPLRRRVWRDQIRTLKFEGDQFAVMAIKISISNGRSVIIMILFVPLVD